MTQRDSTSTDTRENSNPSAEVDLLDTSTMMTTPHHNETTTVDSDIVDPVISMAETMCDEELMHVAVHTCRTAFVKDITSRLHIERYFIFQKAELLTTAGESWTL